MQPPKIDNSTKEERQAYVLDNWKCLHDCEACGKCRILKGRDAKVFSIPLHDKANNILTEVDTMFFTILIIEHDRVVFTPGMHTYT